MMNDFITPLLHLPGEEKPFSEKKIGKPAPALYKDCKLPLLTNAYVASLTVVGLFIVFRFVQKSR